MADPSRYFSKHPHVTWEYRAADVRHPKWFRLMALAYSRNAPNGHVNFDRGELMRLLKVDKDALQKLIRHCIDRELLAKGSGARCLIVEPYVGGGFGNGDKECPFHPRGPR